MLFAKFDKLYRGKVEKERKENLNGKLNANGAYFVRV